ncbi:MAG: glycosyltransferase [Synechococcales cyanobacterium M58_A2018_015]|nr:glycosyltransferase [Synechococcales cyanobacterium M58_A2018_015]
MVQAKHQSVLVSILIPLYNAERFINTAVTSILQEQSIPLEVIVINNGSTDGSLDRLRSFSDPRLRLLSNPKRGIAEALNTGLAAARGQIIMRCDADDFYPQGRLQSQVEWLNQHPEFGAVCGSFTAIDAKGQPVVTFNNGSTAQEITGELRRGYTRTHLCTYAIRNDVLRILGGFRPYFVTGEDIDFQLRLGEVCRVWYCSAPVYHYRLHNASITHTRGSGEREFFDQIAREFQHQRQTRGQDDLQRGVPPSPTSINSKRPLTATQHIQNCLLGRAWREHQAGQKLQALSTGLRSLMLLPSNLTVWRSVLALAVKPAVPTGLAVKSTWHS